MKLMMLPAVEQVENDGDRHQSHDAVAAQRCEEPEQVADDVAAQERQGFSSARVGFSIK
jgi:hypothetical protein